MICEICWREASKRTNTSKPQVENYRDVIGELHFGDNAALLASLKPYSTVESLRGVAK